ncbi:hypothetical protein OUZ56_014733 [Daphnia magna]|uniref:Uncharacterized protein n=1 Tax=Daphnia magna TaxID=35525 RepID=A0ABR0AKN7_9CRUS|nr:hypothetical protein OUZ56_014733 [Daphnia magna]
MNHHQTNFGSKFVYGKLCVQTTEGLSELVSIGHTGTCSDAFVFRRKSSRGKRGQTRKRERERDILFSLLLLRTRAYTCTPEGQHYQQPASSETFNSRISSGGQAI